VVVKSIQVLNIKHSSLGIDYCSQKSQMVTIVQKKTSPSSITCLYTLKQAMISFVCPSLLQWLQWYSDIVEGGIIVKIVLLPLFACLHSSSRMSLKKKLHKIQKSLFSLQTRSKNTVMWATPWFENKLSIECKCWNTSGSVFHFFPVGISIPQKINVHHQ
jgi:hypothetical protein